MSVEDIFQTMQGLVSEQFSVDQESVTMETAFEEDLGADSVDIVELVMGIEEEFEVSLTEEEELKELKTVGDVVNYVAAQLNK